MLSIFYNGSEEEGRKNYQKFYDLSEATEITGVATNSRHQNLPSMGLVKYLLKK